MNTGNKDANTLHLTLNVSVWASKRNGVVTVSMLKTRYLGSLPKAHNMITCLAERPTLIRHFGIKSFYLVAVCVVKVLCIGE
jgi:hypothetical protein